MSSLTLTSATVTDCEWNRTPIGRQLISSVLRRSVSKARCRPRSMLAAACAACARVIRPKPKLPPWPELVRTPASRSAVPGIQSSASGKRPKVVVLSSTGTRRRKSSRLEILAACSPASARTLA